MKNLILFFLIISISQVFSQNSEGTRITIAKFIDGEPIFIVDENKLMRAYEKTLNLDANTLENVKIVKVKDELYNLALYRGNEKWSFSVYISNGNIGVNVGMVETHCHGTNCNGCCQAVEVCTPCADNGSKDIGTCTRSTCGPIIEYFRDLIDR